MNIFQWNVDLKNMQFVACISDLSGALIW